MITAELTFIDTFYVQKNLLFENSISQLHYEKHILIKMSLILT